MSRQNSNKEIYFDNNATTKPLSEVRDIVIKLIGDEFGNPSSHHLAGERARNVLSSSRKSVSELLGCDPENIIFTSSGTEANNLVFYSLTIGNKKNPRIITTEIEHSSIKKMCSFLSINDVEVVSIGVNPKGLINLSELNNALIKNADLVSVQWVNNETGVIQDIDKIIMLCKKAGVPFHTDAAQAIGKLKINLRETPIDFLTFAGHKFHAPQGVGGIFARDKFMLHPFLFGGFQEEGFRPGTENLPGIGGLGKAAEIRNNDLNNIIKNLRHLRDSFETTLLKMVPGIKINGDQEKRICNTTNILFSGVDGRELIKNLDREGLRCSQSSACTNFDTAPSFVLKAMGLSDEETYSSIRFSFSVENTLDEIDEAVEIIVRNYKKFKELRN